MFIDEQQAGRAIVGVQWRDGCVGGYFEYREDGSSVPLQEFPYLAPQIEAAIIPKAHSDLGNLIATQ